MWKYTNIATTILGDDKQNVKRRNLKKTVAYESVNG